MSASRPRFQPVSGTLGAILSAFAFSATQPVYAQDPSLLKAIFELPGCDDLTIDTQTLVRECSAVLVKRDKHSPDVVAKALLHRAAAYVTMGKTLDARIDLEDLCTLQPKNAEARCRRAMAFAHAGRMREAEEEAREAVRLDASSDQTHTALAAILAMRGRIGASLKCLDKAIELSPSEPGAYYLRAKIYEQIDPAKCLEAVNQYLELANYLSGRNPAQVFFLKGMSLTYLNRPHDALTSFLMARKLDRASSEVARELAITYAELGRLHLAARWADEYDRLEPTSPFAPAFVAKYHGAIGDREGLEKAAAKVVAHWDRQPSAFCLVGDGYFAAGTYDKAATFYRQALAKEPDHYQTQMALASFLATCPDEKYRDGAEAVKLATAAYERKTLRPWQKWEPAMVLAEALAETGAFDEAVKRARQAVDIAGPHFGRHEEFRQKLASFEKRTPWRARQRAAESR